MADVNSPGVNKGSPLMAVAIAGIVVIAALLGVIAFLLLGRGNETAEPLREETPTADRAIVVNEDTIDEVIDELINEPPVAMGYYEVSMNFSWVFPDGESPSDNAYVQNKATNNSAIYFDVVLAEDESVVLFESPILPLGTHIEDVTLARDLDAGTYPCVIIYHMVDDQQRTTSTLRMNLEIVVNS